MLRLGFGFPIERDLQRPNFVRGSYLGCPSHPRVLRSASTHRVSVPPWLLAPLKIVQINATMRDSDLSGGAGGLTGAARLCRRLEPVGPNAGVLPVYPDRPSRRAVHADPAGALNRGWLLSTRFPSALTQRRGVRLSGCCIFEAHWMWFTFVTARRFIFLRFQPRLAATLWRAISVVNSPIRRAGLAPACRPASLAQASLFAVE